MPRKALKAAGIDYIALTALKRLSQRGPSCALLLAALQFADMKKIFSLSVVFFSFSLFANASEKTQEYALGNSAYIRVRVIQSGENSDLKKLSLVKFEGGGQTLGFYNSNASYLITFDFNERTHILRYTLSEDVAKNGLLTNTYELNVDSMKVKLSQSRSAIMLNSPY